MDELDGAWASALPEYPTCSGFTVQQCPARHRRFEVLARHTTLRTFSLARP